MAGSKDNTILSTKGKLFNKINDALDAIGIFVTSIEYSIESEFDAMPRLNLQIHGYEKSDLQKSTNFAIPYTPIKIIRSEDGIATIVFWNDGTKTVVKRGKDDKNSDYDAFTAALAIKIFGSNTAVHRIVKMTTKQSKKKKKEK